MNRVSCECDEEFRMCLQDVGDRHSWAFGALLYDIVQVSDVIVYMISCYLLFRIFSIQGILALLSKVVLQSQNEDWLLSLQLAAYNSGRPSGIITLIYIRDETTNVRALHFRWIVLNRGQCVSIQPIMRSPVELMVKVSSCL